MVPEYVCSGMPVCRYRAPDPAEIFLYPCMGMRLVSQGWEKILPVGETFPDCVVITLHQARHTVMQDNIMLIMPF